MLHHNFINVVQDFLGDMADVVADGLVGRVGCVCQITAGNGEEIEELADEGVVGGQVFEFVIITVAGVSDDSENKDLPELEARSALVLALAREYLLFEEFENLAADIRGGVNPLQREEYEGKLVAALCLDQDFLLRNDV